MTTKHSHNGPDSIHGPNIILDVENFGPIAEAKNIEFKPMTVFVGPSNTGKTYLALLLHALLQAGRTDRGRYGRRLTGAFAQRLNDREQSIEPIIDDIKSQIINAYKFEAGSDISAVINIHPKKLSSLTREFISEIYSEWVSSFNDRATESIENYFSVSDIAELVSIQSNNVQQMSINVSDTQQHLNLTIPIGDFSKPKNEIPLAFEGNIDRFISAVDSDRSRSPYNSVIFEILNIINASLAKFLPTFTDSVYFPAARTGIITSHRILTSNVLDNISQFGLREVDVPTFSRSASDFLRLLVGIEQRPSRIRSRRSQKDDQSMNYVADTIEHSVIDGTIEVSKHQFGLPDFRYSRQGSITPMERSSSMATEVAPIVLFLRNYIEKGDLLIIDEPEAHLHPAAQQHMAAALAFMVRSGLRVLITTHSHYMVEQLSAFVNASVLDAQTRKRTLDLPGVLGQEDVYLKESETAVYGFDQSQNGVSTFVKHIPLNEDFEYSPADHSFAVTSQYNRLQRVLEAREDLEVDGMA